MAFILAVRDVEAVCRVKILFYPLCIFFMLVCACLFLLVTVFFILVVKLLN